MRFEERAGEMLLGDHDAPPLTTSIDGLSLNCFAGTIMRPSGTCRMTAVDVMSVMTPSTPPTRTV